MDRSVGSASSHAAQAGRPGEPGDSEKAAGGYAQLVPGTTPPPPDEPMSFSDEADERTLSQF
jgi:hypothetical protein